MTPIVFSGCRGWLHPAGGDLGIVMCGAQGFEELCVRRSWRILADQLAAAGMPVLRFDYPGSGDSIGSDLDPDRVDAWIASIVTAIDVLKTKTGVKRVALMGFRLGCLLATAAAARAEVQALCLLAPPDSGKAFTRELRAMSRIMNTDTAPASEDQATPGLVVCGFVTTDATKIAIDGLDVAPAPLLGGPARALIVSPDTSRNPSMGARLRACGWAVTDSRFTGYAELMCEPTASRVPMSSWASAVDWLTDMNNNASEQPAAVLAHGAWREEAVQFGVNNGLVGILTEPARSPGRADTLVMIGNAGGSYHAGWARQTVELARNFADHDVATLRFNFAGIGDSPDTPQQPSSVYYSEQSTRDLIAAVDWAEARGYQRIIHVGGCSAAYQLYQAALRDARVNELVLVNLQCFQWSPKYQIDLRSWQMTRSYVLENKRRMDAQGPDEATGTSTQHRLLGMARRNLRKALRQIPTTDGIVKAVTGRNRVVERVNSILERGGRMMMVYSTDDVGLIELEENFGAPGSPSLAASGLRVELIEHADHTLTQPHARRTLEQLVLDHMRAVGKPAPGAAAAVGAARPATAPVAGHETRTARSSV